MHGEPLFSWETPEYSHTVKSADWYWAVGIIALAGAVTSVALGNVLFAIVIILGTISLLLYAGRKPAMILVEVTELGIRVGKYVYPYSEIGSFWMAFYAKGTHLLFKPKKLIAPLVVLRISEEIDLEALREFLLTKNKEEELHEPIFHHVMEYLGF